MRLATYLADGPRIGAVEAEEVWDLRQVYALYLFENERTPRHRELAEHLVPDDMALFIRLNHGRLEEFREALDFVTANREALSVHAAGGAAGLARPLAGTRLLPPVMTPSKVICCGSSYGEHLEEIGLPVSDWPQDVKISFLKPPSALIGHGDTLLFPPDSTDWDYENELTIVIGRTCSDVSESEADRFIFGYSIVNDACVRDIPKWTGGYDSPRGKACDTLAPFGPWIVPSPYLKGDPNDLHLKTTIDGEVRQDTRTSGLLWPVQRIVAFVSRYIRLFPGDIITTGSSSGNALRGPGPYLTVGQVVRCEMEGIGVLENTVGVRTWTSDLPPLAPPTSSAT
jgi:2-keto-4-pentenoate hydratase/2-oxohepta-3-ene-1,7-dioic acid hydratase in catechol pathway